MSKLIGSFGGRKVVIACAALVGGLGMIVAPAKGALVLSFSDGTTTVFAPAATINNGLSSTSLITTLNVGVFSIDIANAQSNATAASGLQGFLESNSIRITDGSTQGAPLTLTVTASDTGFSIPGSSGDTLLLGSSLAGSITKKLPAGTDSVSFTSKVTTNGGAFSQQTVGQSTSITAASPTSQAFTVPDASFTFTRTGTYDLTSTAVVTLTNSGDQFNIGGSTLVSTVPEPTSCALVLLGSSMLLRRRRIA